MGIQSLLTTDATSAGVTPTMTFHLAHRAILQVNYLPLAQLYVHQKLLHRTTQLQPHQAQIRRQSLQQQFTACLLYTSPSPRDLSTSRMPSSA